MPIPPRTMIAPHRYGPFATDQLSELPEPAQSEVRKLVTSPVPENIDPLGYAAGFDGMAWMASALGYRNAAAKLHDVASYIRARASGMAHG